MDKKGQGLPLNTIVIAIIVLIVLILVIVFFLGGFNVIIQSVKGLEPATETDAVAAQTKCSQLCIQAQSITNPDNWKKTGYCKQVNTKDWDGSGKLEGTSQTNPLNSCKTETGSDYRCCWDAPINSFCSAKIGDKSLSETDC